MGDEDDIKTLIKKRGSVKSKFTNFQKFVDKLKLKKSIGDHIRESEVIELEERIEKVKNILDEFEPLQIQIELLSVTNEEVEKQERERSSFEDCFYSNMAEAKSLFNELRPIPKSVEQVFINNSHQMQNNQGQDSVQVQGVVGGFEEGVKLPDIKLPTFNGTHEAWLEFRDLYTSLIHCNSKLREIQKFHYLRAALEGSALQVIKSLEFSAENYETAWELVKNRYENKKLLIHNHLEALFSLGKLDRNSANSSNLRKLVDTVSKHLRALETLKMPTKQWDILVIHIIKKCLDDGSLARWEEYRYKNEFPTLEDMYEFLKNRADLLERLEINRSEKGHFSGQKSKGKTLFSSSNSNNSIDNLKKCLVCSGEHLVYQCEKFQSLSVSERNEQIRKLKLCAKCLRAGHYTKNCRLYGGCKKCNSRKHNTLLHTDIDSQTNSSDKVTEVNHGNKSTDKKYADASTVTCHSSMVAFSFDQTLLSTAIVNVLNSEGTPFPVRVVLDSGSQSSYVTEFYVKN